MARWARRPSALSGCRRMRRWREWRREEMMAGSWEKR
jgi:hypothetical protein